MKALDKLKKMDLSSGFVTTAQLNKAGIKNYEITRLYDEGVLTQIRRGYHRVKFVRQLNKEKLILAIHPDAVFCLRYSLKMHGGKKRTVFDIAIPQKTSRCRCQPIEGLDINYFYISNTTRDTELGFTYKDGLPIYDYERTICDFYKYRKRIGATDRLLREILQKYYSEKYCADDKVRAKRLKEKIERYASKLHLLPDAREKLKLDLDKCFREKKVDTY